MPLHLQPLDLADKLQDYKSVLIVSCPVCPPASLASDNDSPFMEFFRHGVKTPAFENHVAELRESLGRNGIRTGVFTSYMPCPATCLWTSGQRKRLLKRARDYDAAVVMGCESARHTIEETLRDADCETLLAMQLVGITNAKVRFAFPLNVWLDAPTRVCANEQAEDHRQAAA